MADRHHNVRVPPDSTGKKIPHHAEIILKYKSGTIAFQELDNITLASSGITGYISAIDGITSAGYIHVQLDEGEANVGATVVDGENIQVEGITYAAVDGATHETQYYPISVLASGQKPHNHSFIDRYGSLYVRSEQGSFQLGPTGRLKVGDETPIATYNFEKFTLPDIISTTTSGTASQATDYTLGTNKYTVGTSPGDSVRRRGDAYNLIQPYYPVTYITTMQFGDSGKEGLVRRWGYFDDNDGFFFELRDTTLNVVIRSSVSGSVVETRIPQDEWNGDRIDGSGGSYNLSEATLDLTKFNLYWISFSPDGCNITWGIRTSSRNIACHVYCWTNKSTTPPTNTWALPVSWEMDATAIVVSTSTMHVKNCSVNAQIQKYDVPKNPRSFSIDTKTITTDWTPIASLRARKTIYGIPNRAWIIPHKLNVLSSSQPIIYRVVIGNTLSGETWGNFTSEAEYDVDATSSVGGITIYSGFAGSGQAKVDEIVSSGDVTAQTTKITTKADYTEDPYFFTLEAKTLTSSTDIYVSLIIFEIAP